MRKVKINNFLISTLLMMSINIKLNAHHYKGLPHYNYFDNYPHVPILEFIEERDDYAVFITIYNFQGLDIDMVDAPNDVRFYIYLYDMNTDAAYEGKAAFNIYSHGKLANKYINIKQEEERIFSIRAELEEQDDLIFESIFVNKMGQKVSVKMPIKIRETFIDKYGLYLGILLFFLVLALIKKISKKGNPDTNEYFPAN